MIVCCDFETYYDSNYSLRKMSTTDYILDGRFEVILLAMKIDDGATVVHYGREQAAKALAEIDWSEADWLSHNTAFDGAIARWHFDINPRRWLDSMSMARATINTAAGGVALAKIARWMGLPDKGTEVVRAIGKTLASFTPQELEAYADYCAHDTELCRAIYDRLVRAVPESELEVIDITMRMFIEPQVTLHSNRLAEHLNFVRAQTEQIMAKVGSIDPSVFSSNKKFADLLEAHGIEVPMKVSPTTGELIPALAIGDRAFKAMREDSSLPLDVQALVAARTRTKSTIEETRTVGMLNLSLRSWGTAGTGWCPIQLKYFGALTGRWSGDGGLNFQNLQRGSTIRDCICAPDGWVILHRDSSQIEARMVAWLAGESALLDAFAGGRDIYSEFASQVYGLVITKRDKKQRFVGKTSILGLGYGMGGPRFQHTLFIGQGGVSADIDLDEATRIVALYRETYPGVPALWRKAGQMIERIAKRRAMAEAPERKDSMRMTAIMEAMTQYNSIMAVEDGDECVFLPNNMAIQYPGMHGEEVTQPDGRTRTEFFYDGGYRGQTKIFGGKLVENISQALSRIVISDAMIRVKASTGYTPFLTTHDSLDYCVPHGDAQAMNQLLEAEFAVRPSWAPTLPLASEGSYGGTLREAEEGP